MQDIRFKCSSCGQSLEAPPEMAGETVECPACGGQIEVPAAAIEAAEGPGAKCPSCGQAMAEGAVLCVRCGFHVKLGRKLKTELS